MAYQFDTTKVRKIYDTLAANDYEQDYETFQKGFYGNENTRNRQKVYDLLKENGYDVGATYNEFMQRLEAPAATASIGKVARNLAAIGQSMISKTVEAANQGAKALKPQPSDRYMSFKLRRGGKDILVSAAEAKAAGGIQAWAAQRPGTPWRVYMSGGGFDGHVPLPEAHNRWKQKGYQYTLVDTRKKQAPAKPDRPLSPVEQAHGMLEIEQQIAGENKNLGNIREQTVEHMQNVRKAATRPLGESELVVNPRTGKRRRTYFTEQGNKTNSKLEQSYENTAYNAEQGLLGQLRNAYKEREELNRRAAERLSLIDKKSGLDDASIMSSILSSGDPMMGALSATTSRQTQARLEDPEYQQYRNALKEVNKRIQILENRRHVNNGGDHGFWRSFWQEVTNPNTWLSGYTGFLDANAKLSANVNPKTESAQSMMKAEADTDEAENKYGDFGFRSRAGVMTADMLPFMVDFMMVGGAKGGSSMISRNLTAALMKGSHKIAPKITGKLIPKFFVKTLGAMPEEILRAGVMANTVQAGKTAADVVDRKLGEVTVDENGNYGYTNDKTWNSAIWQGEANAIIENYSEMFGTHLDGLMPALAKTFGGKRISGLLARTNATGFGKILSTTRKQFERLGISDYFGEVGEEYYGQLWRTMLGLDDAYRQNADGTSRNLFFDGQFHGDIWGGMALSMGIIGAGKYTQSAIVYGAMRHAVNKADKQAQRVFAPEEWEQLRSEIDATTTDNIGAFAEKLLFDSTRTPQQRMAAMNYIERSLNLRGLNLAEIAKRRGVTADDASQEQKDELNALYLQGLNVNSAEEYEQYKKQKEIAESNLRTAVAGVDGLDADSFIDELDNNPDEVLDGIKAPELLKAAQGYVNAKTIYDGTVQSERYQKDLEGTDSKEQQPIGRAVMKYQDRPVEVLSGRVVMMEDGTMIDNERSDASIVIRDIATGKIEMVSPEAILSYEEYAAPTEEAQAMPSDVDVADVEPQSKYTSGQIKIRNSDGTETRGVLTGYVDENGNHEYYVEGDLQHLHYASDHELDNILSEYVPDEPKEPEVEATTPTSGEEGSAVEGVGNSQYVGKSEGESLTLPRETNDLHGNRPEQNHDERTQPRENDGSGVAVDAAGGMEADRDRSDIRVYTQGLAASRDEHSEHSTRNRRRAESERLVGLAKANGQFLGSDQKQSLGDKHPKGTGESEVYIDRTSGIVYKVKDPYAKSPMKGAVEPEDTVYEHLVHNKYFPETRYRFEGISEGLGDARIVLSQKYVDSVGQPTKEQIETTLAEKGLLPEGKYTYGNDEVSVTDVTGDNALLGADGKVYFIDPIINFKKPVQEILGEQPAASAERTPTPLQRIPRDAKGEPIFEQAENPEHGWDALVEFAEGDAATAKEIADTMAEEKRKAYEKAQKQKPKGKTPTEILASKKAISAGLAQAEQEYNLWQQMANVEQRRQDAIRAQQEAEARQRAAERAEAEKAEREACEEAARLEREALEGIPEWHLDTPENARKRGVRRFSGQMFTRQEPIDDNHPGLGREVNPLFKSGTKPVSARGRIFIGDVYDFQPSHVDGQLNPRHFVPEVQPKRRHEDGGVSVMAAKTNAENFRPELALRFEDAFNGVPVVNSRMEVGQGNGRTQMYRYLYEMYPEKGAAFKQTLMDMADELGISPEYIASIEHPMPSMMLSDITDEDFIRLGNIDDKEMTSGGIERIKPKNVAQKLGDDMRTFANRLLSSGDEEASFGQLVDRNGTDVLKWMNQTGAISNTQYQSAFDSKGNLTAEAKNDLQKVLYQAVFKGGSQQLEEMFDKLPAKAQRAILSTAFRDMDSPVAGKMLPEIQASIAAYHQLMSDPTFATAKKLEEVLRAVEGFKQQILLDDRFEQYMPADNFSNFALHLAALYKANDMSQSTIAGYFNQMYDLAQGKKAATLFEDADTTEYPLADVIKKVLNIDYQPAKNGNNNVANGGADVALRNQASSGGKPRGSEPPASREQTEAGAEPSERGGGITGDSRGSGNIGNGGESQETTQQERLTKEAASGIIAEMEQRATVAPELELTIENWDAQFGENGIVSTPIGEVKMGENQFTKLMRQGRNGKLGMIRPTLEDPDIIIEDASEAKDNQTTERESSFVFVKTFTKPDGSRYYYFTSVTVSKDGHEVVVSNQEKRRNVLTNLLMKGKLVWKHADNVSPASDLADGLYSSQGNLSDPASEGTDAPQTNNVLSDRKVTNSASYKQENSAESSVQPADNKGAQTIQTAVEIASSEVNTEPTPAQVEAGKGYKVEPKPYTNKQDKTLDTYLVTFDRDFSKEELSALRAKAKALKGWYDRESKGWMLRSVDDAKAFAEEVATKSEDEVADEAPLSMTDMEKPKPATQTDSPVKKVDVEGLFDALKTKGEAKLSDHAEPVTPPTPKKRRWISDEDANEFDNLRNDLRKHFGKDGDIVQEAGAEYGKPQPRQMDAEVLRMGTRMTYLMMKGGLRSFSDYCEAMKEELPDIFDEMRPHLKSLYAAAQNMEEVMQLGWDEEMDDRKTVKAFDVYNFDKHGAKDIIATAQHAVDENASQQQTDQIIQTLKDQRNEQRKEEADKTSADTEAISDKAEATASQVESELEDAGTEQDAERLTRSLDKEIEDVNKQLALLGYYEADPVESDFNEAYGYMRNAERKAVQDAHRLATQLSADLSIDIDPKDKVRKAKYGFGSKIARSNVAPAGGEVYITLPLAEGRELSIWVSLDKNEPWRDGGREDRTNEDLMVTGIMYRIENTGAGGMDRYVSSNHNTRPTIPYDELLSDIRRLVRSYLPEETVKPATPLTPQPGEDIVDMAKRVASDKEVKTPQVAPEQPIGGLFGNLFDEQPKSTAPATSKQTSEAHKDEVDTLKGKTPATSNGKTPLMKQYEEMKKKHPDATILFKVGDFYETFEDDARVISEVLGLTLTRRANGKNTSVYLAGFPANALDAYLPKLVRAGHRVALCEPLEEPKVRTERKPVSETTTSKPKENERTDVQPRTEETGRGGQQPRPDEPMGAGAKHEDERTDGGRMAQRGGVHSVSDTGRGAGISGQHQSERGVTTPRTPAAPRNTRNNHAERGMDYAPKGEKARIDANLAAIELAKRLLSSGATATPEEMAVLRKYSGWGGLGSAFNEGNAWAPNPVNKRMREVLTPEEYQAAVMSRNSAYYTPAAVIDAMWDIAKALGFKGGNILEGSAGIGNIIGLMPTDLSERSDIHAVEIDPTTGGILSLLYPDAKVEVQGFEQTRIANGSVDLAITNVPFVTDLHVMDESGDSDLSKKFRDIHDFCIAKNVRKLREGGIGIFITSSGTLDKSQKLRNWLVGDKEGNADVVGVFRMNNQTFGGTAATSDIIVVRKRVNGRKSANAIDISTVTPARTATFTDARGRSKDLPLYVNRYFIEHPEHMGGEMFFGFEQGDTYRPTSIGLFPTRTADQAARMAAWVQHIADIDWSKEQGKAATEQTSHINEALGEGVKEGSMVTDSEGNLCVARMGRAVPLTLNKNKIKGRTKEECFKDYTEIKSALADVLKYQTQHDDDAGLQPLLDRLNRAYDTFVQRYGNLNKNNNLAWLRNDVDFSSIVALETYSEKGNKDGTKIKTYGKTDIFSRRVVEKESEPTPKNVKDGIIASIYKYGRIDTEYLATQLGKSQDDVKQEIVESGLGFVDPTTGQMEVSYEYLSGNVREKLRQAREANEAAGGAYDANIKALEAVVPMNIPAHLIEFALGSSWIEPQLYERYVKERTDLDVKLTNAGGTWHMAEPWNTDKPKNTEMGVRSEAFGILIPGHKLIEAALTNKTITVSRTVKDSDGGSHTETDPAATTACATKVDEIRQDFKDWAREQMQNDPALSMRMEEKYNEKFNNSVPKSIPDEFVPEHFGGAATTVGGRPFKLRPHQAKAVIRATTQPVLLAHEVGTGKTYTLITTAMEMRRLGTARKPMIVVQNATVGQFVASAKALYPNAKVLTLEDADRNAEGRKAFYAKIKFNDWDMIVVPQSVFERIPDSIERQTQFIQDKIEEKMLVLEQMKEADPDGRSMIVRAAEREISRLEDEMSQLASGEPQPTSGKKKKDAKKEAITRQNAEVKARELLDRATDDVEDFDSMGIDAILVDEAHEYKHLGFATAMQRGVKGVDPSPSKKSQGVFLKTQAVLEKTGGKNVVFATGTPISNTAAEIWTFMRYLIPADVMKEYDIYYFDDFVRNFGNIQQMLEFKTNGKYDEVNRFAGYFNLPELVRIWSTVADTVLTREAGGVSDKIPQMEGGKAQDIFLPQTRALRSIMKFVKDELKRYEDMTGKEKKENSHIPLVMYGIAKAAAVDVRLVQSDAEDDPNSKTNEAVRQTLRSLEETKDYKGTVAIFADNYQNKASGFNLYEDIRKKLIAAGVPEEQVVVMKSGMTVKKKLEIFDRVNAGEVRVVMGSTFTLGTGVNIQERLHTLIHLDAPNRPMDYTQRNGRILRQGNLHNTWGLPVRVLRFGVEDSLDVTAYQRLKTKGAIADSIMNGKQLMENAMENRSLEEDQDLFGDITAQLSGSEYAMLKNQIEKEVRKLRAAEKNWKADQTYIHNRKRQIAGQNRETEKRIADNQSYLEKVEAATIGDITVGRLSFPSVEGMEDFFTEQNKKKAAMQEEVRTSGYSSRPATSDITISVGGFDFKIHTEITKEMKHQQGDLFATAPAKMTYSCPELGIDAMPVRGNAIKNAVLDIMENVVSGKDFRERIAYGENYLERNNAEFEAISKRDGQPFKDAEALEKAEEKLAEYEELMKAEMAAKEAKYAEMDKDVEAASGIELTEEDSEPTASEPAAEYSAENANFVSNYETKDGKTVRYTSENPEAYGGLFDFDFTGEVPGAEYATEGRRVNRRQQSNPPLQRRNAALLDTNASARLNEANGEYCALERKFRESNYMEFTSAEKVESADDVAFIFEELENASVENVFVVMTKRGVPTVMHISIGGFNWSAMNAAPVKLAYDRIKPDKVYFVHNHPSGALNCSAQDVNCLKQIESAIGKKAEGVIMNLKSGKYGTFDSSGTYSSASHDKTPAPAVQRRLRLYAFDRHVFNPDYQPSANMRNAEDVAKFLSSHRLGDRSKVSVLVCNNQNQIVANVHTTHVSIDSKGLADDIIRAIGEFGGMHAFLYGDFEQSGMVAYRNLTQAVKERSGGVYNLLDVVRIEGNHTWSARDNGYVYEPGGEYGASPEGDIRYREVEDDAVLKEFAEGMTVKAYRTMQVIDGKLYSPMATKVGGKATPEIKLGVPEQAEEHPEIIKRTKVGRDGVTVGYVVIDKGLGKGTLEVAYNPSIHASLTPLNDQFTSADIRPNLVIVETLIPKSELTSGYRAPMAKDAVGEMSWHSGTVSGKLAELGKPRRVILSRYDMPVRIVPFKEVAQMIAAQLEGTDIDIPYNVVTPQVRMELQQLGIAISDTPSGSVGENRDFGKAEYITDQEIERINAHQQEMAQTSPDAKSSHAEKLAKKFNTPIQVVTDPKELTSDNAERQARMRRSKGFYDPATGKVVVVLPNNANVEDVAETVFHEVVAHKGLREMLGDENYDAFCDEVYDHLKDDLKEEVDRETTRRFEREPEKGYEHHRRVSVDEMFGRMAEKGFEDFTKAERGIWAKLKAKVLEAINKFLGSLKLPKWVKLGDNELRYMLWRSHEKLRTKGDYVDMARDAVKREELGLSAEARFRDGETGDIWKDRSVGLEERITNAAIRLSAAQSGDLTLRNDAHKAVVNNLQSLLHTMRNRRGTAQSFVGADRKVEAGVIGAMNAQAMFDRATVKRVSDLARILMQNGYLSGMTSGEMQRLLSVVKNATAMHDISDSVQKIMDIMVGNQLRNAEGALRQLLSIRGSKVDARGVEVQGVLDVEGQRTMEVVKKAMSLTEDDINDRIAEALNRMSDPDQTIADQAALEYAGLNMALDYVQNIANSKAEEKTLRDSLKTAKEDRDAGRMTDDAYKQFVEATEDAIRKNKIERAEAYFNLVGRLSDSLRESIENAKAFREAEKARISKIHHNANSDMEGRPTNEHHKDNWKDKFVNNGFVQFLFAPLGTFDQILRVFGNKSANGEGYLWNRFMRGWVDCRNKELTGVKEKFARLDEKAAELFGKGKTWGNLIRMEAKMPKATVSFWDGGEMRDHELTQGNLLYIYMVDKMTDGRMKLRRMGVTEDDITRIENFLDPRFKALGDWLQDEFLVDTRNEYNETHKRMFGASMAAIENYFPLKILANARFDTEEDLNQQNRPDGITTKTGSIIKRRVNNLALDITGADALSVILDHITQMEHWSAYAEWNRDLNTLRTYKRFRNQVINMTTVYGGGRKLWENFNDLCLMAAGEYRPPVSKLNKSAVNLAKGVTAAKVSFRMYTALKQLLSAPAYAPEVSMRSILKSIANPYGDFKWCLENIPIFRERWHSRISGDPRLLKSDMDWKMWRNRVMELSSRIGMSPNAFVDAVTVSIGARAMYETRLKQYLKEGYPTEAAEKRAMQDATILFNQTQQSSESPFLSTMQVDKDWLSVMFTVFRNSSMSYTRQEFDAMRNLKRNLTPGQRTKSVEFMTKQILRDWDVDPESATDAERDKAQDAAQKRFRRQIKKDVIRVATFGFILELAWNLGPYLPYIIFGNDEDEKENMWDDAFTHAYFGSVEGLTGGDVWSSFGNMWASGEWNWNQLSKDMPLASDINTIGSKFVGGKNAEAINDILNLLVQMGVGMNPQSLTDTAIAITDACGDDPALSHEAAIFAMRVLQVPQSQIDKMYFDEVDLTGEEASKLTPAQLAQRYAEYKVKRGTPLAPWSWGDEERLGKYNDLATDRMKERLDAQGDARVIEAYADFEARYKAVSEKAKEAKALMKTDYAAAAQAHAMLQQDPDFGLYQRFGALDKQLGRISKMWLTSKSPAEASLVASTITSYRAGMVKVLQAETAESQQSAMSELTALINDFYAKYQGMQPKQVNR